MQTYSLPKFYSNKSAPAAKHVRKIISRSYNTELLTTSEKYEICKHKCKKHWIICTDEYNKVNHLQIKVGVGLQKTPQYVI